MKSVARRVVDRRVLHLIKMWLEAPVEETDERRKKRTTHNLDSGGTLKVHRFRPCWLICICAGLCWGGRDWDWKTGLVRGSSTMPTTW